MLQNKIASYSHYLFLYAPFDTYINPTYPNKPCTICFFVFFETYAQLIKRTIYRSNGLGIIIELPLSANMAKVRR